MYAYAVANGSYTNEFFYWRKHHLLHDKMVEIHARKGDNCEVMHLSNDDLLEIYRFMNELTFEDDAIGDMKMGLDMYAYAVAKENAIGEFEIKSGDDGSYSCNAKEFFYWRKHYLLHDKMVELYVRKGGIDEINCEVMQLSSDDLLELHRFIIELPIDDDGLQYDIGMQIGDLAFISKAQAIINAEDDVVYYSCWY